METARKVEFSAADGTKVELEVTERFLDLVRSRLGIADGEPVEDRQIKAVFADSIRGASREP